MLGRFPNPVHLLGLAGTEVLSCRTGVGARAAGVQVLVLVVAIYALLEGCDPAVHLLLRLSEAALDVAPDLRQVVVEEAVLAVFLVVARALLVRALALTLVVAGLLASALVWALAIEVLG